MYTHRLYQWLPVLHERRRKVYKIKRLGGGGGGGGAALKEKFINTLKLTYVNAHKLRCTRYKNLIKIKLVM